MSDPRFHVPHECYLGDGPSHPAVHVQDGVCDTCHLEQMEHMDDEELAEYTGDVARLVMSVETWDILGDYASTVRAERARRVLRRAFGVTS